MSSADLQSRLEVALTAAAEAGELILKYYQSSDLTVDVKSDESPVTAADRGAEDLIRERLGEAFPEDGILGEERDDKPSANGYRWILDPIDGTKPFVRGVPLFGTLLGLEHDGEMVAGVCRFPALNEVVYAANGTGTWWKTGNAAPRQTHVSEVDSLPEATFCFTEVSSWSRFEQHPRFEELCRSTVMSRGWGDCYGHAMVATGRADVMVDPAMSPWDIAALIPIVREAGGYCGGWNGEPSMHVGNGVSVNAALKPQVLDLLNGREAGA